MIIDLYRTAERKPYDTVEARTIILHTKDGTIVNIYETSDNEIRVSFNDQMVIYPRSTNVVYIRTAN